ncbi:MAG: SsrA-binding protein SmpB [Candidatus Hydrogenedentota bacterium]|nr:MAG: SsrA-binding protein SmpB [Candidatus Hydrogenedentota bacterium]
MQKEIVVNKKARFNYEILETYEAGIVLVGSEIKSIRQKKISITEAYAVFKRNELFLINARIEPYEHANIYNHDPLRPRKLLLHRKELNKLQGKLAQKGWVLIPLKVILKNQKAKVILGLGRAKKKHDKRQVIKERDIRRDMERELKNYR